MYFSFHANCNAFHGEEKGRGRHMAVSVLCILHCRRLGVSIRKFNSLFPERGNYHIAAILDKKYGLCLNGSRISTQDCHGSRELLCMPAPLVCYSTSRGSVYKSKIVKMFTSSDTIGWTHGPEQDLGGRNSRQSVPVWASNQQRSDRSIGPAQGDQGGRNSRQSVLIWASNQQLSDLKFSALLLC